MTVGTDAIARARAKRKAVDNPPGTKVTGVDRNTYGTLAKVFMESRGGTGFLISTRDTSHKGEHFAKTTDEWGAWVAYFFKIGLQTRQIEDRGYATVPAQWPHDFDENAPPEADYEAAKHYRASLHRKISEESRVAPADIGKRVQTYWGDVKRGMPIWEEPKPAPAPPRVYTDEEMKASLARCMAHNGGKPI